MNPKLDAALYQLKALLIKNWWIKRHHGYSGIAIELLFPIITVRSESNVRLACFQSWSTSPFRTCSSNASCRLLSHLLCFSYMYCIRLDCFGSSILPSSVATERKLLCLLVFESYRFYSISRVYFAFSPGSLDFPFTGKHFLCIMDR